MMNRTYMLEEAVVDRLDATARRLGVRQSDLVNFLLDQALDLVQDGALEVPTRPKVYGIEHSARAAA